MGLIRSLPLLLMTIALAAPLAAQASGALSLVAEVQNIERIVNRPGASGAERHGALVRLARLYQLSGGLEGAARAWTEAALAEPGIQDRNALLEGALAYIALGEYDTARANVNAVLGGGGEGELARRARYIAAQLEAFSRGRTEDLAALLNDDGCREYRPAMLYVLWRVSGDAAWRARLLAEYPSSPEGRIALDGEGQTALAPQALWFLFPGRESVVLGQTLPVSAVPV
jgi:hypothetical protein